jgi:hypothetical protein
MTIGTNPIAGDRFELCNGTLGADFTCSFSCRYGKDPASGLAFRQELFALNRTTGRGPDDLQLRKKRAFLYLSSFPVFSFFVPARYGASFIFTAW